MKDLIRFFNSIQLVFLNKFYSTNFCTGLIFTFGSNLLQEVYSINVASFSKMFMFLLIHSNTSQQLVQCSVTEVQTVNNQCANRTYKTSYESCSFILIFWIFYMIQGAFAKQLYRLIRQETYFVWQKNKAYPPSHILLSPWGEFNHDYFSIYYFNIFGP